MTGLPPESSEQVARLAAELFADRLPQNWRLDVEPFAAATQSAWPDFTASLHAPDGRSVRFLAEAKRIVERRDISRIRDELRRMIDNTKGEAVGVLVARYLSPPVRKELERLDISYVDATGNMRVSTDSPALFVSDRGADKDPWRGAGRPRGTLKGEPAARVVRTLLDYDREWRATELIKAAGTSVGATYRVIEYLESEELISARDTKGGFSVPQWKPLLLAWAEQVDSLQLHAVSRWIEPRGVEALLARIAEQPLSAPGTPALRYAVTGSVAASNWAPYAPVRSAFIYVTNARRAEQEWQLRPTEAAPNVLLIEPKSSNDIAFTNTAERPDGIVLASTSQVAADLLNGPGRSPSEAEELIEWMTRNENSWRKR